MWVRSGDRSRRRPLPPLGSSAGLRPRGDAPARFVAPNALPAQREAARPAAAFTLIELLIVVAIIAVLAAIAVPNFLEAQVRGKVARVRADLRGIATAIEAYAADMGDYPRNWMYGWGTVSPDLTTPVSYLTGLNIRDPFANRLYDPLADQGEWQNYTAYYDYERILPLSEAERIPFGSPWYPSRQAIDGPAPAYNEGALRKYGQWRLFSVGPDRKWVIDDLVPSIDIPYDPTNGTMSFGNISRTQRDPSGTDFLPPAIP